MFGPPVTLIWVLGSCWGRLGCLGVLNVSLAREVCNDGRGGLCNSSDEINVTGGPDTSPGRVRTSRYINLGPWVMLGSSGMSRRLERLERKPREGGYGGV